MTVDQGAHTVVVNLALSPEQIKRIYQGRATSVTCQSLTGAIVRFPVNILRPYVSRDGVSGRFKICFFNSGKFKSIERID